MASILRVNTLTDASSGNSTAMSTINQGTAKAWINFNGTGTIATRDSFNISSISDDATGIYTITINNDMADTNYCTACHVSRGGLATGTFTGDSTWSVATGS